MRVLILDDAAVARAVLARIVRDLGHEVVAEVPDLESALRCISEHLPDLAIVDSRLPPEGCLAALRELRARAPGVMVAVIAALDEIDVVRAAVAAGAAGAFRRPLLRSDVAVSLRQLTPR